MKSRSLFLAYLSIKGLYNRVKYDLERELVVAACCMILSSLFYYVFNDFLNVEVAALSEKMREQFGSYLAMGLMISSSLGCGLSLRQSLTAMDAPGLFAKRLGETEKNLTKFYIFSFVLRIFSIIGSSLLICMLILVKLTAAECLGIFLASSALSLLVANGVIGRQDKFSVLTPLLKNAHGPAFLALISWRIKQIIYRQRSTKILLSLAILFCLCMNALSSGHTIAIVSISFFSGLLVAFALIIQIASDFKFSWIEKNLGVSDVDYLFSIQCLSLILGFSTGILALCCTLLNGQFKTDLDSLQLFIKLVFIGASPCLIVPNIALQIDARRPAIQVMNTILISIFVCTAIYASLFSLLLLPLCAYYGITSQRGRFYRA